jgi:polyphosphate kinase 2 (PPK2 family)
LEALQVDLKSFTRWDDYAHVRDEMFEATDTIPLGMWNVLHGTHSPIATITTVLSWLEQ